MCLATALFGRIIVRRKNQILRIRDYVPDLTNFETKEG